MESINYDINFENPFSKEIDPNKLQITSAGYEKYDQGAGHFSEIAIYRDQEGNKYYGNQKGYEPKNKSIDVFVSAISKGILRTSDMIIHKGQYLSRYIDTSKMPKLSESESRIESDATDFMLSYLFNDTDHSRQPTTSSIKFQNINFDPITKQPVFYDFSESFLSSRFSYEQDQEAIQNDLRVFFHSLEFNLLGDEDNHGEPKKLTQFKIRPEDKEKTFKLISQLANRFLTEIFSNNNSKRFDTAIANSGLTFESENLHWAAGKNLEEKKNALFTAMRQRLLLLIEELDLQKTH